VKSADEKFGNDQILDMGIFDELRRCIGWSKNEFLHRLSRLCVKTQDPFTFRTNEGSTLSVRSISKNCRGRFGTRSNTKIDPLALSEPFMEFGRFGDE
jgi:hypothetical protein